MKDENGNEIPMATEVVYRLVRNKDKSKWSKAFQCYLHSRHYKIVGACSTSDAYAVLALLWKSYPTRKLLGHTPDANGRGLWIHWQDIKE